MVPPARACATHAGRGQGAHFDPGGFGRINHSAAFCAMQSGCCVWQHGFEVAARSLDRSGVAGCGGTGGEAEHPALIPRFRNLFLIGFYAHTVRSSIVRGLQPSIGDPLRYGAQNAHQRPKSCLGSCVGQAAKSQLGFGESIICFGKLAHHLCRNSQHRFALSFLPR